MDLRAYEESKFAIAGILREASAGITGESVELRAHFQELFARLADDRFNLVVVGRFNRGKTSLMNAILGRPWLPTAIVPLTSVITMVTYGSKETVVLKRRGGGLDIGIAMAELPRYVTQKGNPGNVQGIRTAEVRLPAEILRRGFYLVDTPGLGSVIVENTLTTEAFLPEADAFVLVTSYNSPLSEEELRFFKAASVSRRRVFVVLNKHDTVTPEQREDVLGFVREQLNSFFDRNAPPVFSVSSTEALEAKLSGDRSRAEASGVPELERQLIAFLVAEKQREFLLRTCERVRRFLHDLPRTDDQAALVRGLDALAAQFGGDYARAPAPQAAAANAGFADLHRLPSCEICTRIADKMWDFLCRYQYDIVVSREEQQRFADRGGFCSYHAWQFHAMASPYGICAGHAPLLDRLAGELRDLASRAFEPDGRAKTRRLIPREADCALCVVRNETEHAAVGAVAKHLEAEPDRALQSLSALCLPHFAMLAAAVSDQKLAQRLMQRQAAVFERYAEDMKRYAMKHDAVRRYLVSQEETNAAERGLLLVSGRRDVNFMPRPAAPANAQDARAEPGPPPRG